MGFFDIFKGPKTRVYAGEPIERALKPWVSESYEGRDEISPEGRYKHAWVKLETSGDRINVKTLDGEKVGYLDKDMPECSTVVEIIRQAGIETGTVKCFLDEERGRDGHRAILTLGPHKYQPKPPFKRLEEVDVRAQ